MAINLDSNKRENIILSSILFNKDCMDHSIQKRIPTEFISNKKIKHILEIFNGLVENNTRPTPDMLVEQMFPKDDQDSLNRKVELKESFLTLRNNVEPVDIDLFKEHLNILVKHAKLNNFKMLLNTTLGKIENELSSPSFKSNDDAVNFLLGRIESELDQFTSEEIKSLNLTEGLTKTLDLINKQKLNPELYKPSYVPTGYKNLDTPLSGGFPRSEFSIISARPSMGKTVVMLNSAVEAAKAGTKVLFITIEMSLEQCLQRILSKVSEVNLSKIRQPENMNDLDLENLKHNPKTASSIYGSNLFIEESRSLTPNELKSRINYYQTHFGVDLVFVDYVQIMRTNAGTVPTETSDFNGISDGIMSAAKELDVAIVVGSQLSREVENREDKRPLDSDLRNSGRFEQDAALIIHLYRDEFYNKDSENKKEIEFLIGKNRFGQGSVMVPFAHNYSIQTIYEKVSTGASAA